MWSNKSIILQVVKDKVSTQLKTDCKQTSNKREGFPANTDSKNHASHWESGFGPVAESVPFRFLSKPAQPIRAPAAADP